MKFIHTADWHVGKSLRGRSRAADHTEALAQIVRLADQHRVDAVLIAGDLFDSYTPSPESERIVFRTLTQLVDTGARVVMIAGNHDNPGRFNALKPLLTGTHIACLAVPARAADGGVISFGTRSGEQAQIGLLPFLSQRGVVRSAQLMTGDAIDHSQTYAERMSRLIDVLCAAMSDDALQLFMAHPMVYGGVLGGGERMAHTIFDYGIPGTVFPAHLHYVALGHLHRQQLVPASCPAWYSGSPIALDFSEETDLKGVLLVDAVPTRKAEVTSVPITTGRRLRTLRGSLEGLAPMSAEASDDLLRIVVESAPTPGLADRIRDLFPNAVDIRIESPASQARQKEVTFDRGQYSPQQLFDRYLEIQGIHKPDLTALFADLLEEQDEAAQA